MNLATVTLITLKEMVTTTQLKLFLFVSLAVTIAIAQALDLPHACASTWSITACEMDNTHGNASHKPSPSVVHASSSASSLLGSSFPFTVSLPVISQQSLVSLIVVLAVLSLYSKQLMAHVCRRHDEPPLVTGWVPFFGVAIQYGLNPQKYLMQAREKYGDVVSLWIAGRIITVVLNPDYNQTFYRQGNSHLQFFEPLEAVRLPEVLGMSATSDAGNIIMGCLGRRMIPRYRLMPPKFVSELDYHLPRVMQVCPKSGMGKADLWDLMDHFVLGLSMKSLCAPFCRDEGFIQGIKELEAKSQVLLQRPGWLGNRIAADCASIRRHLYTYLSPEFERRLQRNESVLAGMVDAAAGSEEEGHVTFDPSKDLDDPDLLDFMMETVPDDKQLCMDGVIGALFGAIANTNATLTYMTCHLMEDKECMRKLEAEVKEKLQKETTYESLKDMPYLEACLLETTRLYAIVLSLRTTSQPQQVCGTVVPAKRIMGISSNLAMRRPEYFPNPEKWDPERFMSKSSPARKAYTGFGMGPHLCKGMELAKIEAKMIMMRLLDQWELLRMEGEAIPEPEWTSLGLAYPKNKPVPVIFRKREIPLSQQ